MTGAEAARTRISARDLDHPAVRDVIEPLASIGMWLYLPATDEAIWSSNFARMLGYEPDEVAPSVERFIERVHPGDLQKVLSFVAAPNGAIECRIVRRDGAVRYARATAGERPAAELEGRQGIVGVLQDITDQRRSDALVNAHVAVADAMTGWKSFGASGPDLLRDLAEALGCLRGSIWVERGGELALGTMWSESGVPPELEQIRRVRLKPGEGVAGEAWRTGVPVYVDSPQDRRLDRFRAFALASVQSVLGLPVLDGGDVLAVLVLVSEQDIYVAAQDVRALNGIAHELGQFFTHRRSELRPSVLSRREIELLQCAADGFRGPQIAERLSIEQSTVKSHFKNVYEKLGVSDRAAAVAEGLRLGLVG